MKVITFAGSNSSSSINHQLVEFVASLNENIEVSRLTDYKIPMYSMDIENNQGIPSEVSVLASKLDEADQFVISVAEHNGNITAFFKNHLDWLSRNNRDFLKGKKVIVLETSPGRGGASSAIEIMAKTLPFFGAEVVARESLPSFNHNFEKGKPLDKEFVKKLSSIISDFTEAL